MFLWGSINSTSLFEVQLNSENMQCCCNWHFFAFVNDERFKWHNKRRLCWCSKTMWKSFVLNKWYIFFCVLYVTAATEICYLLLKLCALHKSIGPVGRASQSRMPNNLYAVEKKTYTRWKLKSHMQRRLNGSWNWANTYHYRVRTVSASHSLAAASWTTRDAWFGVARTRVFMWKCMQFTISF